MKLLRTIPRGVGAILVFWLLTGFLIAPIDAQITAWLSERDWDLLNRVMAPTCFEGKGCGLSDLGNLAILTYVIGFFVVNAKVGQKWKNLRPLWGFLFAHGLAVSVVFPQLLKWTMARPRPYLVLPERSFHAFNHWFVPGDLTLAGGRYSGSFPSGHTASVLVLLGIAYALAGVETHRKSVKIAGWVVGGIVIVAAVLMGISRSMLSMHWLSDSLVSIPLALLLTHIMFYRVFRVSDFLKWQELRLDIAEGKPRLWEGQLIVLLALATYGFVLAVVNLRALFGILSWQSGVSLLGGLLLMGLFLPRLVVTWRRGRDLLPEGVVHDRE